METLLDHPSTAVEYKGRKYRLNTSYDNVLMLQRLYEEETLDSSDKIRQALRLLVKNRIKVWALDELDKVRLLEKLMKEQIELSQRPQAGTSKRLIDFNYDAAYIYASFKQAYGMDLIQEQGRLPWRQFAALLEGLPEQTKMKEVMRIRAMDPPKPSKYNQKEIQDILKLKEYYALPVKGGGGQDGLNRLFHTLKKGAGRIW